MPNYGFCDNKWKMTMQVLRSYACVSYELRFISPKKKKGRMVHSLRVFNIVACPMLDSNSRP